MLRPHANGETGLSLDAKDISGTHPCKRSVSEREKRDEEDDERKGKKDDKRFDKRPTNIPPK